MKRALATLATLSLTTLVGAAPSLAPIEGTATEKRPITLTLTDEGSPAGGVAITAIYRQNAHADLIHTQQIGTTASDGTLSWTPEEAGVVVLGWEGGSKNLSVVHDGTPITGLLIAGLAGLLLLGGSAMFMTRLLAEGPPPETGHPRFDT